MARTKIKGGQIAANGVDFDNFATGSVRTPAYATGSIVNEHLKTGTVANAKLANSAVAYGGVSLSLGGTDATPAFNLTDATSLPVATGLTAGTFGADTYSFNGSTISDLGTVTTADIDGGSIDGTVIGANSAVAGSFTAVAGSTGTYSGILKTDDTTEATSTTDGSLQTDGGLSVAKSAVIGDDLDLLSDGAIVNIGSTSKFTLTDQAANNCVMAASDARLAFGNAGEYISGDGTDLLLVSSADVKVTGDLIPSADDTYDLGTTAAAWQDLHLEGDVLLTDAGKIETTAGDLTVSSAAAGVTVDAATTLKLDSATGDISFEDAGTAQLALDMDGTAGEVIMQLKVDSDDFVFKQYDGTEVFRVEDDGGFDIAGGLGSSGVTVSAAGALSADGRIVTDDATEATSTTDGSLQTDGGLSVAKSAVIGDDLDLLSDSAIINVGSTSKFTLTDQAANNCLMATSGHRLAFGAAGEYVSGDGTDLLLVSGDDVKVTGDLVPSADDTYDLGTTALAWQDLHLEGDILLTDAGQVSATTGDLTLNSTAGSVNITPVAGGNVLIDGTLAIDAGVVTGATSITSTAFVGTLTTPAQANITSLGTLSALVANGGINIDDDGDGAIDGCVIGANTAAAGTFTAIVGTTMSGSSLALTTGGATVTVVLDEDSMSSDSATALATQQSIKAYVDAVAQGLDLKESCLYATTATLSGSTYSNGSSGFGATITSTGSVALVVDSNGPIATSSRILVKDMSTAAENGIYTVTTAGNGSTPYVLTRATDFDTAANMDKGSFTFVEAGTDNADAGFVMTQDDTITVGTTDIDWTQFSGAGSVTAGDGLAKSGNTLSLDLGELTAANLDPSTDFIPFIDGGATGTSRKESFSDVATALVYGATGLQASSGIVSLNLNWNDVATHVTGQATDYTVYDLSAAGASGNAKIMVYVNGLLQRRGAGQDYTFAFASGAAGVGRITFISANSSSDVVIATYQQ
jgi:hypothetical protein